MFVFKILQLGCLAVIIYLDKLCRILINTILRKHQILLNLKGIRVIDGLDAVIIGIQFRVFHSIDKQILAVYLLNLTALYL